jgi:cytochrome c biogenesis protein
MLKQETTVEPKVSTEPGANISRRLVTIFASVKLTVTLISLIATSVLIGAWCPQEAAVGQEKVIEQFGEDKALLLIQWGIADIFHSPWFLMLIGLLTLNMVACSFQRVFPKIRLLKQPMPFLKGEAITRLPYNESAACATCPIDFFVSRLRRSGYVVKVQGDQLTAEFGKFSKLAATVTHIGLLTLLTGVTITSWTGFSGFKPVRSGSDLTFGKSEHSKLWIGKLPTWNVHVNSTRREDYPTGEAKQWYSSLSVVDKSGHVLSTQEISVNNPLTYQSVDVYQSSWGLDQVIVSFNGTKRALPLRPMGKRYAAFLPLDETTVLILSVKSQTEPLRIFAKRSDWQAPHLIAELAPGKDTILGAVKVRYEDVIPVTGLQYKCDPGLPVTFVSFGFIIMGVILASFPYRLVWAAAAKSEEGGWNFVVGGRSVKARVGFERTMQKIMQTIRDKYGDGSSAVTADASTGEPRIDASVTHTTSESNTGVTNSTSNASDDAIAADLNKARAASSLISTSAESTNDQSLSFVDQSKDPAKIDRPRELVAAQPNTEVSP